VRTACRAPQTNWHPHAPAGTCVDAIDAVQHAVPGKRLKERGCRRIALEDDVVSLRLVHERRKLANRITVARHTSDGQFRAWCVRVCVCVWGGGAAVAVLLRPGKGWTDAPQSARLGETWIPPGPAPTMQYCTSMDPTGPQRLPAKQTPSTHRTEHRSRKPLGGIQLTVRVT
jgi:hypothetical protein